MAFPWLAAAAIGAVTSGITAYGKYKATQAGKPGGAFKRKANTGYLRKYMSDLQGRSADRARTELAMRPALRAIGAQQQKGQRQLAYQSAQQGLTGSGIEAQKQLTLQQGTTQAVAGVGEKVLGQQLAQAQQMQAQKEGQRMKLAGEIGRQESAVSEANRRAQFQTDEQNRAEQEAYQQRVAQRKANMQNAMIEGVTGTLTAGIQGQVSGQAAFDASALQQQQFKQELALKYKAEGGVVKGYQGSGVVSAPISEFLDVDIAPKKDVLVDYLGNDPGYAQALTNYQTQQNEARSQQHTDKKKQFNLYTTKMTQKDNLLTEKADKGKLTNQKRKLLTKLNKEKEVLDPGDFQPYELGAEDSSIVARSYLGNLYKGKINQERLFDSVDRFVEKNQAKLDTRVDDLMIDIMEMEHNEITQNIELINSDNLFELLRNPDFKSSSNYKTNKKTVEQVLNAKQKKIEEIAGAEKKVADKRGTIKREIVQNVHSLGEFFKTATKIPAVIASPATTMQEAVEGKPASYDIQDNFQDVLAEMKTLIAADDGGIPDATYEEILGRVKDIVDDLTIPLSQLQDISEKNRKDFSIFPDKTTGAWQIEGGDAKFKRILIEELTKNLSKAVMWDDKATVEDEDEDNSYTSSGGIEYKVAD